MAWTRRIIEVTDARPEPRDIAWTPVEAELGTSLPTDYRELWSLLDDGYCSGFLRLLRPRFEAAATDGLLYSWRWNRRHPEYAGHYKLGRVATELHRQQRMTPIARSAACP